MELIRDLNRLHLRHKKCAVTIGNFDGLHLGHQQVIKQLKSIAVRHGLSAIVIIFEPQPQEYFSSGKVPARLTCFREKLTALKRLNIDGLVCLRFNSRLANLSADKFVEQLLIEALQVCHLIVGDDFRFGKDRQGDYAALQRMAERFNYRLHRADTYLFQGEKVSSTRIRRALEAGDLELARLLLGRAYAISGRVIGGDKRGTLLGFPTANISPGRLRTPLEGVYITRAYVEGDPGADLGGHHAVTSIGTRPTFNGQDMRVETHILNFNGSIYKKNLHIEFLQRLRSEEKFPCAELMVEAMKRDIKQAKQYFADEKSYAHDLRL